MTFRQRLAIATRAAVGLFSDQSATQAYGLLSGIYPAATGSLPQRGTRELLKGYTELPWLRAVTQKISQTVAATQWQLLVPTSGQRNRVLQRYTGSGRQAIFKAAVETGTLRPVETHLFLDALQNANDYLEGPS